MKEKIFSTELVRDFKHVTDHERERSLLKIQVCTTSAFHLAQSVSLRKLEKQVNVYRNIESFWVNSYILRISKQILYSFAFIYTYLHSCFSHQSSSRCFCSFQGRIFNVPFL